MTCKLISLRNAKILKADGIDPYDKLNNKRSGKKRDARTSMENRKDRPRSQFSPELDFEE